MSFAVCHRLFASSSRIRNAVGHFRMTGLRCPTGFVLDEPESEPIPLTFVFALADLLPSLPTLEVWDLGHGRGVIGPLPQISLVPCNLTRLEIVGSMTVFDEKAIFTILSAFNRIHTVVLDCSTEEDLDASPVSSQIYQRFPATAVDHIEVIFPGFIPQVLARLPEQIDMGALRGITAHQYLEEGLEILLRSASVLESLVYMPGNAPPPIPSPNSLRVIGLTCSIIAAEPESPTFQTPFGWEDILRDLSTMEAPDLRELTVTILLLELGCWGKDATASEDAFAHALASYPSKAGLGYLARHP
ncbi:uncharacterized protein PHACADRAFT_209905 [Phanerochaete carnosa HHB-10118-sp]|uniref:Uncharacterized protein n=1 Tax=Phanerochaete carnosa (strain HHB-10118-sp) TaxID=650164 RepID=K5VRF9_PHACS|nr:uncharacterized protein PHACADRAFT_209905 [Phanerochaete carnosa HHB-10118-sp]EKM54083.1 hypothetical protein PHACADRAFT_209905 [Phanerochaete carnosa HHB-10118-sp]